MTRRLQFSLRALLLLTFFATALLVGAAHKNRADRRWAISDAEAMLAYRKKVVARLHEQTKAGNYCAFDPRARDKAERRLREAEEELRELKGE